MDVEELRALINRSFENWRANETAEVSDVKRLGLMICDHLENPKKTAAAPKEKTASDKTK